MIVKQLSVFLENKAGRINDVVKVIADAGINMTAFSIAENLDFGIMRVIVSDVEKAVEVLRAAHFAVKLTDVICLDAPNVPGSLQKILELLASEEVFIEYMYAFSRGSEASVVIRPTDTEKCARILAAHGY
jgi:hypothetical protein